MTKVYSNWRVTTRAFSSNVDLAVQVENLEYLAQLHDTKSVLEARCRLVPTVQPDQFVAPVGMGWTESEQGEIGEEQPWSPDQR